MADVTDAFLRGRQIAQEELAHTQAMEDNKLRSMVLKHQLSALKVEDALRTRDIALKQAELMGSIPAAQQPQEPNPSYTPTLPSTSFGGAMTAPGSSEAPTTVVSPQPQAPSPTQNVGTSIPAVDLPEAGISLPAMVLRRSLEDTMAQQAAAKNAADEYTLTAKPGETSTRFRAGKPIASVSGGAENKPLDRMLFDAEQAGDTEKAAMLRKVIAAASQAKESPDTAALRELQISNLKALTQPPAANAPENPVARAIAEYRLQPPSARTLASPAGQGLMKQVTAINPAYDTTHFQERQKMRTAFTSGNQGQQALSLNTAIEHLGLLNDFAHALKNGTFTPGNDLYNRVISAFGQTSATNFTFARDIMAGELATAMKKNGATDPEIEKATKALSSSGSPAQVADAIQKVAIPMIAGKARAMDEQYHATMGKDDPFSIYTPGAKAVLDNLKAAPPKAGQSVGRFQIVDVH